MPVAPSVRPSWLDVHSVDLDVSAADLSWARSCLDADERTRADRGTALVARHRAVLRAALRHALARVLLCAPAEVPLTTTPYGRPVLPAGLADVDFSCSRRSGTGLVAVARGARVGVDVERVRPWTESTLLEGWLSSAEVADLLAVPAAERPRAAARSWAEKEAVLKAIGTGLHSPPTSVPTTPGRPTGQVGEWRLVPVSVAAGFEAVVATSQPLPPGQAHVIPTPLMDRTARILDVAR